ncbi:peptidase domain-containing ABC transporter [methane-oxidizing endosymbiont of Gigantopelta aegis]|uniref:peptidase domain-containing ABC transporter n=1 Tax=methane-oxidizing endosymbiont of Gigantopelta aegis TaxID=2794938 RepID=UPI0018DEAEA2|nr:peptidase domain-containing ABC transporter [methane-oxidizing endosymbiont of Gigantopelta aegis]
MQKKSTDSSSKSPDVAEKFARALREKQIEHFSDQCPYAACLFPLLKALGWKNIDRELIEALPHFANELDLVDLRNILVNIGYESSPQTIALNQLQAELYPALFITSNEQVYILLAQENGMIRYFDAQSETEKTQAADQLNFPGTAYLFTDKNISHGLPGASASNNPWFSDLLARFQKLIIHLLGMTFVINLVALLVPLFIMIIYDKVIGTRSLDSLPMLLSGVAILIAADLGLRILRARLLGTVAGRMDYLIGVETFKKLLSLPPLSIERSTVAAQLAQLKQFDAIRDFFTGANASIVLELPFVLLFLIVVAVLSGPIALIPFVMIFVYLLIGLVFVPELNRRINRSGKARTNKQNMLLKTLSGRKEIKSIAAENVWWERFREVSGEAIMANYQTFIINSVMSSLSQAIMTLTALAVLAMGTLGVIDGSLTMGGLIATMALVWRILSPLQGAFLSISKFQQTFKSIRQINQLMKIPAEKSGVNKGLVLQNIKGHIRLDRVSFRYGPSQDPALLGVSVDIQPGEMVAIVGYTGSGKSTLLKSIVGMYSPQGGAIHIDGVDMRQLNILELRRSIAYVPQYTTLFHGTIAQNLRLANGLATDTELESAAEKAGILEDILALPEGFNTRLTDKTAEQYPPGFLRSLSIARALVSPARIILFDEPGASLDFESDTRFMKQLKTLKGHSTIVMVSHRPSHIRLADKVVVMKQGAVQFIGEADKAISILMEAEA